MGSAGIYFAIGLFVVCLIIAGCIASSRANANDEDYWTDTFGGAIALFFMAIVLISSIIAIVTF